MLSSLTFVLVPGVVRVGHIRVSVFGFIAAAGLIAAIWLSQYTARWAKVSAQKLWDAGVFAVLAAFIGSRALLVAGDPQAFLHYPLLVLSLPSLTRGGVALTVVAVLVYLWVVKLPLVATLDAWTPPVMVLGAVLALAHFVEGTDAGMPTRLPWGVHTPGDTIFGRVQPVQIYWMLAALLIGMDALRVLRQRHPNGLVAARGLLFGGLSFFVLDMLAQPTDTTGAAWLDPGQWVALGCATTGGVMLMMLLPTRVKSFANEMDESRVKEQV